MAEIDPADTVLNAKGLEQAELVGKRLSNEGFDIIYCSDLERCKQVLYKGGGGGGKGKEEKRRGKESD